MRHEHIDRCVTGYEEWPLRCYTQAPVHVEQVVRIFLTFRMDMPNATFSFNSILKFVRGFSRNARNSSRDKPVSPVSPTNPAYDCRVFRLLRLGRSCLFIVNPEGVTSLRKEATQIELRNIVMTLCWHTNTGCYSRLVPITSRTGKILTGGVERRSGGPGSGRTIQTTFADLSASHLFSFLLSY